VFLVSKELISLQAHKVSNVPRLESGLLNFVQYLVGT